jgi:hypothetical protein
MVRNASIPSTATGFYTSVENDGKIKDWHKRHGEDAVWGEVRGVWRAKPRTKGSGLWIVPGAKRPFPEILILPKYFMDGQIRKILTRFATNRHVQFDLRTKEDNLQKIVKAFAETQEIAALTNKLAKFNPDVRIQSIATETYAPDEDDDDEEEGEDDEE